MLPRAVAKLWLHSEVITFIFRIVIKIKIMN